LLRIELPSVAAGGGFFKDAANEPSAPQIAQGKVELPSGQVGVSLQLAPGETRTAGDSQEQRTARAGKAVLGGKGFDAVSLLLGEALDSLADDPEGCPPAAPGAVELIIGKIPLDAATAALPRSLRMHPGVLVYAEGARDYYPAFLIDREWQSYEWSGRRRAKDDDAEVRFGFRAQVVHATFNRFQPRSSVGDRFPAP
jgi:hypothetical protein